MHQFLPFIVIGLATGAVYGMAGVGLVLTYKTSGIFNFGYGAVAALDAYLFYFLHTDHGLPWPLAALVCVAVFAPLLGLGLELLARLLDGASDTIKVVSTVGVILLVTALGQLWHGSATPTFPHFLPQSTVRMLGVNVTWEQIIIFAFSLVASALLYWFFLAVRLGVVMRGVVDNSELVAVCGDDPVRVRRWAWMIGAVFASIAGLMVAPALSLDGVTLTTAVFASFGAAAIGYFSNLPLTFAGGLLVGIGGALLDKYAATVSWVGGLPPSLPFLVLFVVLIVTPRARLAPRRPAGVASVRRSYQAPGRVRLVAGAVAIVLLALVPSLQAGHIAVWSAALIYIILFLSLGLLVRQSGQISLCQLGFAAVGAAAFSHLAVGAGLPWLVALLLATLIAVPVGALVAIPAVRLSGVFLALATLGLGIVLQQVFYPRHFMFGTTSIGIPDPRPMVKIGNWDLSSDTGFYYLLLLIVVLCVLVVTAISHGRLGRLLGAMSDSPLALETQGTTSTVLKVLVFCIAAAMASLAGALTGMLYQYSVGTYFGSFDSLTLVALVVIVTIGEPWYAVIAAIGFTVIPGYITNSDTSTYLTLLFGIGAAVSAHGTRRGTTPEAARRLLDRLGGRAPRLALEPIAAGGTPGQPAAPTRAPSAPAGDGSTGVAAAAGSTARSGPGDLTPPRVSLPAQPGRENAGLVVRDLTVRFGGVRAVSGVSLTAPAGAITGLVGPNGAGKTTTFNACSGLNRPSDGQILLHGADVTAHGPAQRARRGLGRTFQRIELFNSLTVRQNVALGHEAALAGRNPASQLVGTRAQARAVAAATADAITLTGIEHIADLQVGLLPLGQRRLVELARVLAGRFDLLLLDEPSSGLDAHETEGFGRVLTEVVRERGCGILLVEHDMTLVRAICDRVYVLDFGALIFSGTTEEMARSEQVRAAYLGDMAVTSNPAAADAAAGGAAGTLASVVPGQDSAGKR
ncbi:branched-chain amino acid transport system ATP-binding protein [Frankia sp. AiPs1]|uniref:ABC transporter permease subunit n=1 Tax=Frankia sp. AiPa1 TaxID=573492 RepID=UPI00202B5771|nr:ATP-binding cassette domain-containing protein [Frankia sp. AiPa1]MCL9759961.1 branched-chain amino acid ABC transporter permease/ATP-binding protein [Frankia sp. AiPa1]